MAAKKKKTKLREPNIRPVEQEETIAVPEPKKKPLKGLVKKANDAIASEKLNRKLSGAEQTIRPQKFPTQAELLSGDKFCHINWYYPGGNEAFPVNPELRRVDRYYPYAKEAPLLVDETNHDDRAEFYKTKKSPVLAHLGFKYAVILRGEVVDVVDGSAK